MVSSTTVLRLALYVLVMQDAVLVEIHMHALLVSVCQGLRRTLRARHGCGESSQGGGNKGSDRLK